MREKALAIDFDGTICDTGIYKQEYILRKYNRLIKIEEATRSTLYNLYGIGDREYDMMVSLACSPENTFEAEPVEGAVEAIKKLSKNRDIYLLTGRGGFLLDGAKEWLKKHSIKDCIKVFLSSELASTPKMELCQEYEIDILIDDDPGHFKNKMDITGLILTKGYVYPKKPSVKYCKNWSEILEAVDGLPR